MPLFKKKGSKSGASGGGTYPQQQPSYPTQKRDSAPSQVQAPHPGQYQTYPGQATGLPPPYQAQPGAYPPGLNQPIASGNPNSPQPYPYPYPTTQGYGSYQPQASPYTQQPGAPVQVRAAGSFDQGARFDPNKAVSIPPPPPGVAPTAAQIASSQGQSVVMSQQKRDIWGGGSDGGYTVF